MSEPKKSKLPLLLIFFTVFIDLIGFGIIIPVLPTVAEKFGADGLTVGLLMMSYSLMQFLFTPFWGRLSDKVGRRPMLLMSLAASGIGYTIWGFAGSLPFLFLSRIVAGFGNANLAVAQAYIADITTEENRAKGMGLIGAAFGLGFVLGPAIGGICAHHLGYNNLGFVAAGFSFLDLILTALRLPEPEKRSNAGHDRYQSDPGFYFRVLGTRELRLPLLIFFTATFAFSNMETTLVLLTEKKFQFTMTDNSWMFTFVGLVMVFVQGGLIGRLSKKYGEKPLVTIGCALATIGLLLIPTGGSVPLLYGALALLAIGSGINTPSNQSIISRLADPAKVGGVMGVAQSLSTLGRILGPLVAGGLFQHAGMSSPYWVAGGCTAIACMLSLGLPKLPPKGRSGEGKDKEPQSTENNSSAQQQQKRNVSMIR